MPRCEAFTNKDWQARGACNVVVVRTHDDGWLQAGVFQLDLWCLGIKDAFFTEPASVDWPRQLERIIPAGDRAAILPACARKLVEGAAAYAESLGFAPHHDYKKARRVFGGLEAGACPETFVYGKDGKPLFIAGPDDDDARIERVLRTLMAKVGKDGFHYILPVPADASDTNARDSLQELLAERPEGTASFESVSGFLTALEVCPTKIPPDQFMANIWGDEAPWFAGARDALIAEKLVLAHRDEIAVALQAAAETDNPLLAVDFEPEDANPDAPTHWCAGFRRVLELWPEAWQGAEARAELRPHIAFIRAVAAHGRDDDPDADDIPIPVDELPEAVGRAVLALQAALPRAQHKPDAGAAPSGPA